eukprot:15482266-Alexandrium_andersonii.AAC.1
MSAREAPSNCCFPAPPEGTNSAPPSLADVATEQVRMEFKSRLGEGLASEGRVPERKALRTREISREPSDVVADAGHAASLECSADGCSSTEVFD